MTKTCIDDLLVVDVYFGILAAVAALKEENNRDEPQKFDAKECLFSSKERIVEEEAYFGKQKDEHENIEIKNSSLPVRLLFSETSEVKNLRTIVLDRVKSKGYIDDYNEIKRGGPIIVEKNKAKIDDNRKNIKNEFETSLNLSYQIPNFINLKNDNFILINGSFHQRYEHTMELSNALEPLSINKIVHEKKPHLKNYEYSFGTIQTVISEIPWNPNEELAHFICCIDSPKDKKLQDIFIDLDEYLSHIFACYLPICKIMKKISKINTRGELFIKKIIARTKNSEKIIVVFSIAFISQIRNAVDFLKRGQTLPIDELQNRLNNNISGIELSLRQRPILAWKKIPFCEECQNV